MLELVGDFFGRKKECVGAGISGGEPPWVHEVGGAPRGWARPGPSWPGAGSPCCVQCQIFSNILEKKYFIFRAFGELLFLRYFLLQGNFRKQTKILSLLYLI